MIVPSILITVVYEKRSSSMDLETANANDSDLDNVLIEEEDSDLFKRYIYTRLAEQKWHGIRTLFCLSFTL